MDYKYGITILTNTKPDLDKLGVVDGIYFAAEFPETVKGDVSLAKKWLNQFLKSSKSALSRTLWEK